MSENMKYKAIMAACVCILMGGLGCAAVISQAKAPETDSAEETTMSSPENEPEIMTLSGNIEVETPAIENETELPTEEEITDEETPIPDDTESIDEETAQMEISQEEEENEYADLAIANVDHYVNVRTEPSTDGTIVGKIYSGAVAHILSVVDGENGEWFQVVSGNVEGYTKAEYFFYGDAAAEVIDDYVARYATVLADRLNVRSNPGTEFSRVGYINKGERVQILEDQGEWLKVQYTESVIGFVSAEYVTVSEEFVYAKTLEEEAQERAAAKALAERQRQTETQAAENTVINVTPPDTTYTTNGELRQAIVDFAMQFLGNKYVHGGKTLEGGTDCSGFTSLIYAEFGYSLSRTPEGQYAGAGRSIDYSEIQPGDIICYGSKGKCTHVAIYIGDGQIIHSANPRKGVVIYQADYDTILGIRNVID